jgi:hypothetical protein
VKGDEGVFDVFADGHLVFSKHEQGRFPTSPDEVLALIASRPKA